MIIARCDHCNKELPVKLELCLTHNREELSDIGLRYCIPYPRPFHIRTMPDLGHQVACCNECKAALQAKFESPDPQIDPSKPRNNEQN